MTGRVKATIARLLEKVTISEFDGCTIVRLRNPDGELAADLIRHQEREIRHFREALEAIADGEGDAQDIARQTIEEECHV